MPTLAEDLADGCIRITRQGATAPSTWSGPDGMSILELVERVGAFFGLDTTMVTPGEERYPGPASEASSLTGFVLDKARRELGYAPHTFEEGLAILRDSWSEEPTSP
ncbi:MAG: hypothetical protein R2810_00750 [Flavobacteriales bacterium]